MHAVAFDDFIISRPARVLTSNSRPRKTLFWPPFYTCMHQCRMPSGSPWALPRFPPRSTGKSRCSCTDPAKQGVSTAVTGKDFYNQCQTLFGGGRGVPGLAGPARRGGSHRPATPRPAGCQNGAGSGAGEVPPSLKFGLKSSWVRLSFNPNERHNSSRGSRFAFVSVDAGGKQAASAGV